MWLACVALTAACAGSCTYQRTYAEQSSSAGRLVTDTLALGPTLGGSVVFGCETHETGEIHRQLADGVLGLGRGDVSVVGQLAASGVIADEFSLCTGSWGPEAGVAGESSANGAVVFGALGAPQGMVYSPLVSGTSFYKLSLRAVRLGGVDIAASAPSPAAVSDSYGHGMGTVLDSGTTFIFLPTLARNAFMALLDAGLPAGTSHVAGPGALPDVCFQVAGASTSSLGAFFPNVTLELEGAQLTLPPANYLFAWGDAKPDAFCLGVFDHGDSGVLLGAIAVRDVLVTYDRAQQRIGFRTANCTHFMHHGHTD